MPDDFCGYVELFSIMPVDSDSTDVKCNLTLIRTKQSSLYDVALPFRDSVLLTVRLLLLNVLIKVSCEMQIPNTACLF